MCVCVNVCHQSFVKTSKCLAVCEVPIGLVDAYGLGTGGVCTVYSKLAQNYVNWLPCHYMGRLDEPSFRY